MSDRPTPPLPHPLPAGKESPTPLPSVWPTGQRGPLAQLRDAGCVPGTETDAERIPPAVAAHAITAYSHPGDLVVDPSCGAGTVLTEALRAGRHALGLTPAAPWWALARGNITAAKTAGAWCDGSVFDARPRALGTVRAAGLIGRAGLVLTALRTETDHRKDAERESFESVLSRFATTLHYCEPLLHTGGRLVVVTRPRRNPDGALVDLTTPIAAAATAAGLALVERCLALTAELRGSRLLPRSSIADRRAASRTDAAGEPTTLTAHHEVLVFGLDSEVELAAAASGNDSLPTEDAVGVPTAGDLAWRRGRCAA
ncbi:DNA methyltransferase [Amycolatopsis sp. cg13]|uniref:DNA methyltransferase n=1 Tax=Amycolatopsis sp. cg13 TaxID=3238807 RepID=UPI003524EDA5